MTSVSTPTTGASRTQRSRNVGVRLGGALAVLATGIAIGFAIAYTPVETTSVATPGTTVLDPSDAAMLNQAANFNARQQAAETAAIAGVYSAFAEGMKTLTATDQQAALTSADHWLLKQAAAASAASAQRSVDPADRWIFELAARTGSTQSGPTDDRRVPVE